VVRLAHEVIQVSGIAVGLTAVIDIVDVLRGFVEQVGIVRINVIRGERAGIELVSRDDGIGIYAD